jgi:Pentapeptide repeats (8 copies)
LVHRGFTGAVIVSVMVEEKGRQTADKKEVRKPWTLREFGGKTLWDWMGLLIVPVVLSLITVVFAWQQDIRQDQIEDKRAKAERELAKERAQDEALQAYLDQMSGLLLERDLRTSEKDSEVRTLARARTLTALKRLDPSRKTVVMQFLVEADLVQGVDGREPVISLSGADLGDVNLSGADLHGANLREAFLRGASLSGADLRGASLGITKAGFAHLSGANQSGADLSDADLSDAILSGADLSDANLSGADLSGAWLGDYELAVADLGIAKPGVARLPGADLSDANLSDASLSGADLHGATMPNGQKYEDWLKSKGSGKD